MAAITICSDFGAPQNKVNQFILKEVSPGCSLEGLMLKLKLQYFGHLTRRADHLKRPWCWEKLRAGGEGDDRGWDGWMASPTWWTWIWASSGSWWWTGKPGMLQCMGLQRVGRNQPTEQNWTITNTLWSTYDSTTPPIGLCLILPLSSNVSSWRPYSLLLLCIPIGLPLCMHIISFKASSTCRKNSFKLFFFFFLVRSAECNQAY